MEQFVSFKVDKKILEDFDVVAKFNRRHRTGQLQTMMVEAIKRHARSHPEAFKEAPGVL